jgi:transcriptional regulator with XRE-family HTH domain
MSPEQLGQVIIRLRAVKGLSQQALATRAKVTQGYIAQLETGTRRNPSLPALKRLAKALGVDVGELLS